MNAIAIYRAPQTPRPDLGPRQLQWLRDNVSSFEVCERLVLVADRHRAEMWERVRK